MTEDGNGIGIRNDARDCNRLSRIEPPIMHKNRVEIYHIGEVYRSNYMIIYNRFQKIELFQDNIKNRLELNDKTIQ